MGRPQIGVMGSATPLFSEEEMERLRGIAAQLGKAIVAQDCILVIGTTAGLPGMVCEAVQQAGGFTVEISPASSAEEHQTHYGPADSQADVRIFTGFGYKGRNVINVRSADIVLIFGGSIGTLNELTIAYDEEKIIGVLEGTGGVADAVRSVLRACNKETEGRVVYEQDPERLMAACLVRLKTPSPKAS
ncbi:MAG: hypothetical protein ACREOH_02430 [Candidatus Entotheonellia bacterium]